jgi:Tol biopolymer transport system component
MEPLENPELWEIVFDSCLAIQPEPSSENEFPWVLLIGREVLYKGTAPYVIDPTTAVRTEQLLVNPGQDGISSLGDDFAVSPDGKWLAHAHYGESEISIFVEPSTNLLTQSSQERIVWHPSQLSWLEGWLSNENVLLINEHSTMKFGSTLIYNPFTGEQHEFLLEEMPNSLTQQYGMLGSYLLDRGNLIPDPTLTRIVYPLALDAEGFHVALSDTENKKELARIEYTLSQLSRGPFWSQDGSDFLMTGLTQEETSEWFQVSRDGTVRQVTHFGEFLQDAEFNLPSRSWDGRYLAFQLISNARKDSKYIFLDLKSQPLDGFCLNLGGEASGSLRSPVWSPDDRYVAITNGDYSGNSSDVILVDVEKQQAFHIDHGDTRIYAEGWIVKP